MYTKHVIGSLILFYYLDVSRWSVSPIAISIFGSFRAAGGRVPPLNSLYSHESIVPRSH